MDREELKAFEGRIENWCFVLRQGIILSRCASVEGRYRPPEDEAKEAGRLFDVRDAWLLEDAWRTMMKPWAKWMIKWHFANQFNKSVVVRMLKVKHQRSVGRDTYEHELQEAVMLLKKNLDMRLRARQNQHQQFDSRL